MEDLLRIVREAATLEVFNYIHAAAIVTNGGHLLKKESSLTAASQFSAIVRVARPYIGKIKERALANFIWALGCSGRKLITADEKDILEELIGASRLTLDNFNAQDASNTAWSLAVMEHDDPAFMTQLLGVALPKLHKFTPQNVANMVYALAKQKQRGAPDPGGLDVFLKELVQSATEQLADFNAQNVSNTAWSLAVLEHDDPVFISQLIAVARPKLSAFTPHDLSSVVYALAKSRQDGAPDPRGLDSFLRVFVASASSKLGSFTGQALCNTSWALGVLGYRDLNFLSRVQAICESGEIRLSPREKVNMKMWLAKLS